MATLKELKSKQTKFESANSLMNTTKTMAITGKEKANSNLRAFGPYAQGMSNVIGNIVRDGDGSNNHFLQERDVKKSLIIVISSDKGICGGFNKGVIKAAEEKTADPEAAPHDVITVGRKASDFFEKNQATNVVAMYPGKTTDMYADATMIGGTAVEMFTTGQVDEVSIAYNTQQSSVGMPRVRRLLPVVAGDFAGNETTTATDGYNSFHQFEPDLDTVANYAVPQYVNSSIYGAMLESAVGENASRAVAADGAAKKAGEKAEEYKLAFNRARQAKITTEITEIVAGAEALR
ncbi:MAG: ATP synthase F1 subunit gamma [Firmicutes bacterium]|nr:ATP synthase F1 subunit gamma [Bacillota bacterium]